jgi:hypothetical protein
MRINDLLLESTHPLFESVLPSYHPTVRLGEDLARTITEAALTADQISQLFQTVQKQVDAGGGNRTTIGKGVDAGKTVAKAYTYLKQLAQDSGPVKGFDSAFDKVAAELKTATGGDAGVMRYIQSYRNFAKAHPVAQKIIYSTLVLGAGIAAYGALGPAGVALKPVIIASMKFTDKLLQGEKFSTAAIAGAEVFAAAEIMSKIGGAVKAMVGGGTPTALPKATGGAVAGADAATPAPGGAPAGTPVAQPTGSAPAAQPAGAGAADAVTGSSPTSKGVNVIKKMIAAGEIKTPEDFKAALKTAAQQAGYNSMQAQSGISNIQSALQAELRDAGYGSKVRIIDQDFVDALAKKATGGAAAAAQPTGAGAAPEPKGSELAAQRDADMRAASAKAEPAAGPAKAPASASISNTTGTDMLDAAQQDPKVKKVLDYLTKDINDKFAKVGSGKLGSEVLQNIQKDLMKQVDTLYPAEAELQMTPGQKKQLVYQLVAKAQDSYIESSPKLSGIVNDTTSKLFDKIGSGAIKTELDLDKFIRSEIIGQNPDLKSTPAITSMLTAKADSLLKNIYSDAMEADPKLTKDPEWKIKAIQQYLSKKESINFDRPALTESQVMEAFRGTMFHKDTLTEAQVRKLFQQISEGPWDAIKKAGSAVAGSKFGQAAVKAGGAVAKQIGITAGNMTNKVTADKLMGAWKKAGSPTDSTAVFEFLKTQGIDENILRTAFKAARIPVGRAKKPAATPGAATAGGAATGKPGTAGTTPSGVPAISAQYNAVLAQIQKLPPAEKQKAVKYIQTRLAAA